MNENSFKGIALTFVSLGAMSFNSCNLKNNEDKNEVYEPEVVHEYVYDKPKETADIEFVTNTQEDIKNVVVEVIPEPTPEPTKWHDISAYFYLTKNAYLFNDQSFDNPLELVDAYQKVFVFKTNYNWTYVMLDNGKVGYMEPYLLYRLADELFVEVDISDQTTKLYNNHKEVYSTSNVTGKDSTPTDIGYFDIDSKTKSTYLTSYNPDGTLEYSTYVDYWMPYNYGEGLHDAPWQNGHFGDKEWYHTGGSHGCVNMPSDAAGYIYDNVDVGTMVLVHK